MRTRDAGCAEDRVRRGYQKCSHVAVRVNYNGLRTERMALLGTQIGNVTLVPLCRGFMFELI